MENAAPSQPVETPTLGRAPRAKPRERILRAARTLFYEKGYASVGINEVLQEADAAKASFYQHFPSKEALIHACLDRDHHDAFEFKRRYVSDAKDPRERILSVFDACMTFQAEQNFRGCHFTNALAALHENMPSIRELAAWHFASMMSFFEELIVAWKIQAGLGEIDVACLARALTSLLQGATMTAQVELSQSAFEEGRNCADAMLRCASEQIGKIF
ncbi:MAG: TetR/AcrR family transcriptional regulator [Planctomycetes bacterium]|nr:TetR/AcrR family transcriptional regulator [Planctomycetota bacterium]